MGRVLDLIDRVKGKHIFLSSQEATKVCRQRLTVTFHFAVGGIPSNVVQKIGGDVASRPVSQSNVVRESVLNVDESSPVALVLLHETLKLFYIAVGDIVRSYLRDIGVPRENHLWRDGTVELSFGVVLVVVSVTMTFVATETIEISNLYDCAVFPVVPLKEYE